MKVAAINDLSSFGKCSLIADISILSSMGIEVCPVPTAVLTAQTGFPSYHMQALDEMILHCKEDWLKMKESFDGILTGYLPSEKQANLVLDFVNSFNVKNTVLLVDPVMGDNGKCYSNYNKSMLTRIKELVKKADIITPNLTELCLLAEVPTLKYSVHEISDIAARVRGHDKQAVVVTGISLEKSDELNNLVLHGNETDVISCKFNGISYSGTGDLFAATLLGHVLNGKDIVSAVSDTTDFISRSILTTQRSDRNYGVDFEKILNHNCMEDTDEYRPK